MSRELNEEGMKKMEEVFRKTGLPEELLPAIRKEMRERREEFFAFPHETEVNGKYVHVELALHWNKAEAAHELTSMGVAIQKDPENRLDTNVFLLMPHSEVSVREAVNLMKGRAVHQSVANLSSGSYWFILEPDKQYQGVATPELRKSGLNLWQAVHELRLPVALSPDQKMAITRSLEAGDRYALNFTLNGKSRHVWLQANPEEGRVDLLNMKGQRMEWKDFEKEITKEIGHRIHR